jgi:integrase
MFALAELWGLRDANSNPVRGVQRFRERRRERLLTDTEVNAIFAALGDMQTEGTILPGVALAVRLLWATGCRMSEIIGLEWQFVNGADGEIRWPDSKGGGAMAKPLTIEMRPLLDSAERVVGNPFVCFGADRGRRLPVSTLEKGWRRVLQRAGVRHCGLHALRHLMATQLAQDGTDIETVRRLMGHKTAQTTLRYFQTTLDRQRDAADRLSAHRARRLTEANPPTEREVIHLARAG